MTRYLLTPAAQGDLDLIWDYTMQGWGSAQAERYLRAIRDACAELALGQRLSRSAEDIRTGYSKAAVGSHLLFFRRDASGDLIIVRILHRRMDAGQHISPPDD